MELEIISLLFSIIFQFAKCFAMSIHLTYIITTGSQHSINEVLCKYLLSLFCAINLTLSYSDSLDTEVNNKKSQLEYFAKMTYA